MRSAPSFQPRPDSMKSRDIVAMACASRGSAGRMVMARGVMAGRLCHEKMAVVLSTKSLTGRISTARRRLSTGAQGGGMDKANIVDLADDIKARAPGRAAAKLANLPGKDLANELMHL